MLKITHRALALLAVTVLLAGCANDASDSGSDGSAKLRVVLPNAGPTIAGTIALGIASGTFQKAGVDVELEIAEGAQAVNAMVAGRADLTEASTTSASSLEVQGKDTSAVWANSGGGLGLQLFAAADAPKSMSEFQSQKSGKCAAGVTAPGGSGYGYTTMLNKKLRLDCKMVVLGDSDQILGALMAGRIDVALSTGGDKGWEDAVDADRVHVLLDPDDLETQGLPQFPERVLFGLADKLSAKKKAVVSFMTGMRQAAKLYASADAGETADKLLTVDAIKTDFPLAEDREVLVTAIEASKPYVNWTDGYISSEDWEEMLKTVATWGDKDFDPKDPKRSYDSVVDMSFYDESKK